MAFAGAPQLYVLLPSGGPGAVRAPDDPDPERTAPHGCADWLDQYGPQLDSRWDGFSRGTNRRSLLPQVADHVFAHRVVADDIYDGVCRRLADLRRVPSRVFRRDVFSLDCDGGR